MIKSISRFFIPQSSNNHRALLLHPSFLAIFIAIYLLNQSFIKSFTIARPGVLGYSSEITVNKVLEQTNNERIKLGLKPLTFNSTLSQSAESKAADMFARDYWAHTSPTGKTPWDFFKAANYEYSVAGENLAKDFYDTEGLIKSWMSSPTHRANIVNPKYQEIGLGVVNGVLGGVKTTLVVQHFGTPRNGVVLAANPPVDIAVAKSISPSVSPIMVNKVFAMFLFVFIISLLIVDSYITLKNNTRRLTGSTAGHIGFLIIILMLLIFAQQGTIF